MVGIEGIPFKGHLENLILKPGDCYHCNPITIKITFGADNKQVEFTLIDCQDLADRVKQLEPSNIKQRLGIGSINIRII